ncbi:hypothetical protein DM02DRAFT_631179 [Periconia macrospinosa]|uniref:Uncharacterized protein n=1 Tax=Periconia macrospinosa TaxID=97972 RepID=A0A2V1DHF6_9PLEO|nr:hypothetical protein DM02DRAFT_631179 [Periconia macrospinosa]
MSPSRQPKPVPPEVPILYLPTDPSLSDYNITFSVSNPTSPYELIQVPSVPYFRRMPPNPTMDASNSSDTTYQHGDTLGTTTPEYLEIPATPLNPNPTGSLQLLKNSNPSETSEPQAKRPIRIPAAFKLSDGHKRAALSILGLTLNDIHLHGEEHGLSSHCTSQQADIRLLDFDVTAVELLTYFPKHTIWYGVADRLYRAGWTGDPIVKFVNWSRAYQTHEYISRPIVNYHQNNAQTWFASHPNVPRTAKPSEMTDRTGGKKNIEAHDYYLVDLAEGVHQHPTGSDAGCLTRAIAYAREHGDDQVKLSEVSYYIYENQLSGDALYDFETADRLALERLNPITKDYQIKVLGGAKN